ncbi:GspH/FimT family pseudopilin [Candidatus Thiodictyon syntrophicum]|jgi:general secretion pathway protein H|uniref:Type II secretion system protein H n=1 Tax=Candidatus Thiodictyon syntrophicum TaxID=1166950 RepID=A0A2K8U2Y3_9GAMM|nr:type II secretion system protein GspH [Candidatus Thiodictyon syntrophicum]
MVELLVVMAIAALLLTAVPPLISAAFPGVELKAAARRTAAALRLARESAIRTGADAALVVDVQERTFALTGMRTLSLPSQVHVKLNAASREMLDDRRGAVRFFPDGSSTGGVIILTRDTANGGAGYQVGVNWLTGRVRMAPWERE